ncbi:MAG: GGDEF domain-containing protein [Selenomonas sp.]|uniref:GGDEF domain-containing protein n=1 Tax=Selenomonas sp. TaxID=2053611 RepID=UPI0025E8EE59|nr:GGDEF domain-containing protein [Selenomonas sp.]MCR5757454.1 GGDEF domain-containing protein [Selenomonas sp.]
MELDKAMRDYLQKQGIFYKMFDVIRLVEQNGNYVCSYHTDGSCTVTHESCYSFWGRKHPCSNCVSRQAYNENRQHVKFEYARGRYYFVVARPVMLEGHRYALECVMDVTEQFTQYNPGEENFVMNLVHELERVSARDSFTGLYNKKYLLDNLNKLLQKRQNAMPPAPLYLALWDIDCFKQVNDTYGHDMGDKVLLNVAQILQKNTKKDAGWAARFGGDEFAVVFYDQEKKRCDALLQHIQQEIANTTYTCTADDKQVSFQVTASFGLSDVVRAPNAETAISMVDKPLYSCKYIHHRN